MDTGSQPGRGEGCSSPLHLLHRGCPVSVSVTPTTARELARTSAHRLSRPTPSSP
jgi:hypothetical protein